MSIDEYINECRNYMKYGGLQEKYAEEKDVEEDLLSFIQGRSMQIIIKNQVYCDCPKKGQEDYIIDLVIKADDGYLPIEIKHCISANKPEIDEDLDKLDFYSQHYEDIPLGLFIYYTKNEYDVLAYNLNPEPSLIDIKECNFYYKIVYRDKKRFDSGNAISFDKRWNAKEM